jgi:hypothetical protein
MVNLRVLIAKSKDDEHLKQSISTKHNDEFIKWVKDHFMSLLEIHMIFSYLSISISNQTTTFIYNEMSQ